MGCAASKRGPARDTSDLDGRGLAFRDAPKPYCRGSVGRRAPPQEEELLSSHGSSEAPQSPGHQMRALSGSLEAMAILVEGVHQKCTNLEETVKARLEVVEARLTCVEGRVRFLETEAPTAAQPAMEAAPQDQGCSEASRESTVEGPSQEPRQQHVELRAGQTTTSTSPSPSRIREIAAAEAYRPSSTEDFIAKVRDRFKETEDLLDQTSIRFKLQPSASISVGSGLLQKESSPVSVLGFEAGVLHAA